MIVSEVNKKFAKNLKALREQNNLSLRALAEVTGVSYQTLHCYEHCMYNPSIDFVKSIADYFGKTIEEMIE